MIFAVVPRTVRDARGFQQRKKLQNEEATVTQGLGGNIMKVIKQMTFPITTQLVYLNRAEESVDTRVVRGLVTAGRFWQKKKLFSQLGSPPLDRSYECPPSASSTSSASPYLLLCYARHGIISTWAPTGSCETREKVLSTRRMMKTWITRAPRSSVPQLFPVCASAPAILDRHTD